MKLQKLIRKAGINTIDMDGKFVAIKMHFGELGNLAYLRPNYAKAVADVVKENGGLPFLTDCNTLYPGSRKNALEHLDCANINGFNAITTGCQILIGDGLRGTDDIEVPVRNGEYCKTAFIGRAVMDADIFISLTHFKGHEQAGFGGAIKNIGMGCGSRAGKMLQHQSGHPHVDEEKCRGCMRCARAAVVALAPAHLMPLQMTTGMHRRCLEEEWQNIQWLSVTDDRVSTSALSQMFRRTATAMEKMMHPYFPTSECSLHLILLPSIRPV